VPHDTSPVLTEFLIDLDMAGRISKKCRYDGNKNRNSTYRIVAHHLEPISYAVEQIIEMIPALLLVEPLPKLMQLVGVVIAVGLEDISRFEKNLKQ